MGFWHWARQVDDDGKVTAKRMHGLELQPRWNSSGPPPLYATLPWLGLPKLKVTHPFHFKMTPGVMLGPTCNHDLGVLLRIGKLSGRNSTLGDVEKQSAVASMLDAMGDGEYYCATYSSKDSPHVEGLLCTLADSLRHKENGIAVAQQKLEQSSPQ